MKKTKLILSWLTAEFDWRFGWFFANGNRDKTAIYKSQFNKAIEYRKLLGI